MKLLTLFSSLNFLAYIDGGWLPNMLTGWLLFAAVLWLRLERPQHRVN